MDFDHWMAPKVFVERVLLHKYSMGMFVPANDAWHSYSCLATRGRNNTNRLKVEEWKEKILEPKEFQMIQFL